MQYQQTPQGLQSLYDLPTAFQPQGLALLGQQQDADQMVQQDQARQLAYDNANDPLKLREKGLQNDTLAAQLPGVTALSNMHVRKDSNEAKTNDQAIKDIMGKYSSAELGRHVTDAENLGTRLSQMGEEAFSNPMGAAQRVKAELGQMGHSDLWNPDWETSHPGLLARQLGDYGKDLQGTSAKFRSAMELAEAKAQAALSVAGINAKARTDVADTLAASRAAVAKAKAAAGSNPKNLEALATSLTAMAQGATDADTRKMYEDEAADVLKKAGVLKSAGATVTTGVKPNLPALGIQDNNSAAGVTTKAPSGWPDGAVSNPDGSVTYNGKTYKKK